MLPLTQIRGNPISDGVIKNAQSLVGASNVVTALSLIEYDNMLKPVMEYVFGSVLICPDMEIARRVAFHPGIEKKTITLEGDVFDPQVIIFIFLLEKSEFDHCFFTCELVHSVKGWDNG